MTTEKDLTNFTTQLASDCRILHAGCYLYDGNPSAIGGGFKIIDGAGSLIIDEEVLKPGLTNNEATLLAIAKAVELARHGGKVVTNSKVIARWIHRGRAKGRDDLDETIQRIKRLIASKRVRIEFKPRQRKRRKGGSDDCAR